MNSIPMRIVNVHLYLALLVQYSKYLLLKNWQG